MRRTCSSASRTPAHLGLRVRLRMNSCPGEALRRARTYAVHRRRRSCAQAIAEGVGRRTAQGRPSQSTSSIARILRRRRGLSDDRQLRRSGALASDCTRQPDAAGRSGSGIGTTSPSRTTSGVGTPIGSGVRGPRCPEALAASVHPRRYLRSDVYFKAVGFSRRRAGPPAHRDAWSTSPEYVIQDIEVPVAALAEFLRFFHGTDQASCRYGSARSGSWIGVGSGPLRVEPRT